MTSTASAAITDGRGNFRIEPIDVSTPEGDEVLVEIRASGICHTDVDSMRWGGPLIMGHEGAGVVKAVGERVRRVSVGDRVVLSWAIPCDTCGQCMSGNPSLCEVNSPVTGKNPMDGHARLESSRHRGAGVARSFNLGTMAALAMVREAAVVPLVDGIPFSSACILGCGVMTGVGSVLNAARVVAGSAVAVLGAGGVGLNVIQGARIAGAARIIVVDISEERLAGARRFGATDTIVASKDDAGLREAAAEVKVLTGGRGADYAFECTAVPELGVAPLAMIRNAGTAVQVSGIEREITVDMELFEWDKIYLNPLYGKCRPAEDFPRLFDWYREGDLLLDELVTRTYALDELADAFDDLHAGRNAKGVIVFDETEGR